MLFKRSFVDAVVWILNLSKRRSFMKRFSSNTTFAWDDSIISQRSVFFNSKIKNFLRNRGCGGGIFHCPPRSHSRKLSPALARLCRKSKAYYSTSKPTLQAFFFLDEILFLPLPSQKNRKAIDFCRKRVYNVRVN